MNLVTLLCCVTKIVQLRCRKFKVDAGTFRAAAQPFFHSGAEHRNEARAFQAGQAIRRTTGSLLYEVLHVVELARYSLIVQRIEWCLLGQIVFWFEVS